MAQAGEDAHGWEFKVQKALNHATNLGLAPIPFNPEQPADVMVVPRALVYRESYIDVSGGSFKPEAAAHI